MCVAAIAWQAHPRFALVIAANRDEFHARPAAALSRWKNGIIAGQDLHGGGTWLGVSDKARVTLITNFRVEGFPKPDRPSRGALVTNLLTGGSQADSVVIADYNPLNLFHADGGSAAILSNYPDESRQNLPHGIHGLSNGAFSQPWPKTQQLCEDLAAWLSGESHSPDDLFQALRRETPDETTPHGPEQRLSGVFIRDPVYGTRCSTVIVVDHAGQGQITERVFDADGHNQAENSVRFDWLG